jgi:hypothetical protein
MDIEADRTDLSRVRVVAGGSASPADGEVRITVDSFGLTSNNVTYAVFGEAMRYWDFFPASDPGWGRVPVWGFGTVAESRSTGIEPGTRVYGYFPMSDSVVVAPGRLDSDGFSDTAPHRAQLPSVYNRYSLVVEGSAYLPGREDHDILLRPLFITSYVVDDFLGDHHLFGASMAVISSASSKTAIGSAHLLGARPGLTVVGLTSPGNRSFVEGLGCYDTVATYDDVDGLASGDAVYIDVAGRNDVTAAVHAHFGSQLRHSMVVGDTHWADASERATRLDGPRPEFLFAPDQIAKRRRQLGREGFEALVAEAWLRFVTWTDGWLQVHRASGADAVETVYRQLLDGHIDPRVGHVCTLGDHHV